MATTLADVAARAGVSTQTVSNTINTPDIVRPATRSRVEAAILELDYQPNEHARRLRTRTSRTIGVRLEPATDGVHGALLDLFLHALAERAASQHQHVLLFTASDHDDEIERIAALRRASLADAFVLTATDDRDRRVAALVAAGTPFVAFGRPWVADAPAHAWVDVDGFEGTRAATDACLAAGATRVGFLGWPEGPGVGAERHRGWRETMLAAGTPASDIDALERRCHDDIPLAADAAEQLVAAGADALVCASDTLALGAIGTLTRLDRTMPVVGFDNTAVAAGIGFSSVDQDLTAVAAAALALLPTSTAGTPSTRLVRPHLVVRTHSRWGIPTVLRAQQPSRKEAP